MLDHSDTQHLSSYFSVQKKLTATYSIFLAIGIDKWWLAVNLKTVFNSLLEQAKHWEWKNLLIKFPTHAVLGNRWQREGAPGTQHTPGKTYTMNVFAPFVTSCLHLPLVLMKRSLVPRNLCRVLQLVSALSFGSQHICLNLSAVISVHFES